MNQNRQRWLMPVALAVALAVSAGLSFEHDRLPGFHRVSSQAHPDRRDFTLVDTSGRRVSLDSFRGKWTLLFFGYTNCPDACPTALLTVENTLKEMGAAARDVQPVFVTIDPARDTAAVLKDYLANFGDNIVGLSGSDAQIAAAAAAYQVFYRKHPTADGAYMMEHSTGFTLLAPDGAYVRAFRSDDDPATFAPQLLDAMGMERR